MLVGQRGQTPRSRWSGAGQRLQKPAPWLLSPQGKSAERVIGALDRQVARESFYVTVSRVKRELRLYASEAVERLIERVEKPRAKENPGDVVGCPPLAAQPPERAAQVDGGFPLGKANPNLNPVPARSARPDERER